MSMAPAFLVSVEFTDGKTDEYKVHDWAAREGILSLMMTDRPMRYIPLVGVRWYDVAGLVRAAEERAPH